MGCGSEGEKKVGFKIRQRAFYIGFVRERSKQCREESLDSLEEREGSKGGLELSLW